MMLNDMYDKLGRTIVIRAVRDYYESEDEEYKDDILDFLSSEYAFIISDGLSRNIFLRMLDYPSEVENAVRNELEKSNEESTNHKVSLEYVKSLAIGTDIIDLNSNVVGTLASINEETNKVELLKDGATIYVHPYDVVALSEWLNIN